MVRLIELDNAVLAAVLRRCKFVRSGEPLSEDQRKTVESVASQVVLDWVRLNCRKIGSSYEYVVTSPESGDVVASFVFTRPGVAVVVTSDGLQCTPTLGSYV